MKKSLDLDKVNVHVIYELIVKRIDSNDEDLLEERTEELNVVEEKTLMELIEFVAMVKGGKVAGFSAYLEE